MKFWSQKPSMALSHTALVVGLALLATFGALRVHWRVQTTLTGYDLAKLKEEEAALLEERSSLKMQLARLTTKKHLLLLSESTETAKGAKPSVASR